MRQATDAISRLRENVGISNVMLCRGTLKRRDHSCEKAMKGGCVILSSTLI
jgi:hypothetical protein